MCKNKMNQVAPLILKREFQMTKKYITWTWWFCCSIWYIIAEKRWTLQLSGVLQSALHFWMSFQAMHATRTKIGMIESNHQRPTIGQFLNLKHVHVVPKDFPFPPCQFINFRTNEIVQLTSYIHFYQRVSCFISYVYIYIYIYILPFQSLNI